MWVRSLGQEDPLEDGMETHSSILSQRIPWTEEPGGYSPLDQKESNMTEATWHIHMHPELAMVWESDTLWKTKLMKTFWMPVW